MSTIFIPEVGPSRPPRVSPDSRAHLSKRLGTEGLAAVAGVGRNIISTKHQPLAQYIISLGTALNELSEEGVWPLPTLKIGASLAIVAYQDTGYYQTVDEVAIQTGNLLADLGGIPDTFLASLGEDSGLADIAEEVVEVDHIHDKDGGIRQILQIGAGCTRHYMQQAILAAA